jgi:hypothetical protein
MDDDFQRSIDRAKRAAPATAEPLYTVEEMTAIERAIRADAIRLAWGMAPLLVYVPA